MYMKKINKSDWEILKTYLRRLKGHTKKNMEQLDKDVYPLAANLAFVELRLIDQIQKEMERIQYDY